MKKKKIVLISRKPQTREGLSDLFEHFEVRINEGSPYKKKELCEALKDIDGLFCDDDVIDKEIINKANKLKIIANFGAGFNNIDTHFAHEKGIFVTNIPDVLSETVADFTMGLLLSIGRRIVEANNILKGKDKFKWEGLYLASSEINHKTLGIIGLGSIGRAVVNRAKAFNMNIIYYDLRKLNLEEEKRLHIKYKNLNNLLHESDYLSIHCDLNKSSYHLIGEEQFKLMKPTSFLINVARGAVVNEEDLIYALKNREIAGAALDVFENEPYVPSELLDLPNVIVTPHMASGTYEARLAMTKRACKNIIMALNGESPQDLVNP